MINLKKLIKPFSTTIATPCLDSGYSMWDSASIQPVKRYFSSVSKKSFFSLISSLLFTSRERIANIAAILIVALLSHYLYSQTSSSLITLLSGFTVITSIFFLSINLAALLYVYVYVSYVWSTFPPEDRSYLSGSILALESGWIAKCHKHLPVATAIDVKFDDKQEKVDESGNKVQEPQREGISDIIEEASQLDGAEQMFFLNQKVTPLNYPFFLLTIASLLKDACETEQSTKKG